MKPCQHDVYQFIHIMEKILFHISVKISRLFFSDISTHQYGVYKLTHTSVVLRITVCFYLMMEFCMVAAVFSTEIISIRPQSPSHKAVYKIVFVHVLWTAVPVPSLQALPNNQWANCPTYQ